MTAGMARLKVTFMVDADGILSVSAREEHTGQEASIRVKPSYGLTDDEVERMIRDSFEHAEDDMGARLLTVERVEADRILGATRGALLDSAALLIPGEREAIERAMAALEAAKAGTDHLAMRAASAALDEVSKEFARRRMNAALDENVRGQALDAVEKKVTQDECPHPFRTRRYGGRGSDRHHLKAAAEACGAHLGSACGGVCACSTCHVYVREGLDDLSPMELGEEDRLDGAFDVRPHSRLGCQTQRAQGSTLRCRDHA